MASRRAIVATRANPVQERSAQRVETLLDSAAQLIDELGMNAVTTRNVAARAESSVGILYRYFISVEALLTGLAARNRSRYLLHLDGRVPERCDDWQVVIDAMIDAYEEMLSDEPGFSSLRFGEPVDIRFVATPALASRREPVATIAARLLSTDAFNDSVDFLREVETIVEVALALVSRAHARGREDAYFTAQARSIAADLVASLEREHSLARERTLEIEGVGA